MVFVTTDLICTVIWFCFALTWFGLTSGETLFLANLQQYVMLCDNLNKNSADEGRRIKILERDYQR